MATFAPRWHPPNPAQHPPNGWAPPFQGAPPIPPGVNVLPSQWNAGFWQFNPNYNPQLARPNNINWMPGQAWGHIYNQQAFHHHHQQQQQQQSHNPFKRQPRAPSAEYLATELSDNPLGLTNMIPAEELERQERQKQQEQEQHNTDAAATTTPWIWTPRPLENDDSTPLPDSSADPSTHEHGSASTIYAQVRPGPSAPHPARYPTEPVVSPNHNKDNRPSRNATEPPPNSSASRGQQIYASPANPPQQTPERPTPESFTSKAALQPTFSVNIVRTPDHYASPSPSRASHRSSPHIYSSPSRSSSRGASVDALSSQLNHLTTSASSSPNPLSRHSSMPNQTTNGYPGQSLTGEHLTDEPSTMDILSPLIIPITPKSSSRSSLGRHSSVPTVATTSLDTIPETPSTSDQCSPRSRTPGPGTTSRRNSHQEPLPSPHAHSHSRSASRPNSRPGSTHTSPYSVPQSNEPSPVSPPHSQGHSPHGAHFPGSISSASASASHTSHSATSTKKSSNPLPPPPAEITYPPLSRIPPSATATTPALYQHSSQQRTSPPSTSYIYASPPPHTQLSSSSYTSPPKSLSSPPQQKQKRRKGYWNRRGDHVTAAGYVVYAPAEYVYPKDLDHYPDGKEGGYMDHLGNRTKWVDRPPLIPEGGYEKIIEHVYI